MQCLELLNAAKLSWLGPEHAGDPLPAAGDGGPARERWLRSRNVLAEAARCCSLKSCITDDWPHLQNQTGKDRNWVTDNCIYMLRTLKMPSGVAIRWEKYSNIYFLWTTFITNNGLHVQIYKVHGIVLTMVLWLTRGQYENGFVSSKQTRSFKLKNLCPLSRLYSTVHTLKQSTLQEIGGCPLVSDLHGKQIFKNHFIWCFSSFLFIYYLSAMFSKHIYAKQWI